LIVTGFKTARDGIARETALLQQGRPAMLLWQSNACALVVPSALARRAAVQQQAQITAAAGWPLVTRGSGGGIVPQWSGTVNLAMIVPCPAGFTPESGYHLICSSISAALSQFDIPSDTGACQSAFCDGDWNLLVKRRKLVGTAQRLRMTAAGRVALIHAAILTKMPAPEVWPIMNELHKAAFPESSGIRAEAHIALEDLFPQPMNPQSFLAALADAAEERLTTLTHRQSVPSLA